LIAIAWLGCTAPLHVGTKASNDESDADTDADTDADSDSDSDSDTDTGPPLETFNQAFDRYTTLFDPSLLHVVQIDLDPADYALLQLNGENWLPAVVTIDGEALPLAGVELTGDQSSFGWDGKVDLRLDFDRFYDGMTYAGLEHIVLDDQAADPTGVAEVVANRVLIAAGVSTPRAGFATVQVQGATPMLYTLREEVDVAFLQRWWAPTGPLWEATDGADFTASGLPAWDGDGDPVLLEAAQLAIQTSGADFEAEVGAVIDLDQLRSVWAWQAVLANSDGWPYDLDDVWLYGDPAQANRFVFLPWHLDEPFDAFAQWDAVAAEVAVRCRYDAACDAATRTALLQAADTFEAFGVATWAQEAFDLTVGVVTADPTFAPSARMAARAAMLPVVEGRPAAIRAAVE
jgi:hypothetical protein